MIVEGMVLLESKSSPTAIYEFLAEITLLKWGTAEKISIMGNYQPVVSTLASR